MGYILFYILIAIGVGAVLAYAISTQSVQAQGVIMLLLGVVVVWLGLAIIFMAITGKV